MTVNNSNETEDVLMTDDTDFIEESDEAEEPIVRSKGFNLDMRHKIESRLEQRRLDKELNEYQYFDIDDD